MQLREQYREDVVAVTLNVDYDDENNQPVSDELKANVAKTLTRVGADCENLICSDRFEKALETWHILGLPAAVVFDRDGEVAKKFDAGFSYKEDVEPIVEALVAAKPAAAPKSGEGEAAKTDSQ